MDTKVMFSSNSTEWETPDDFYKAVDSVCHFDIDVCASHDNSKCGRYYTERDDGLSCSWSLANRHFPFEFLEKAHFLVKSFSFSKDVRRDGSDSVDGSGVNLDEFKGSIDFSDFDFEVGPHCCENCDGIMGGDIPSPCNALVVLSRFLECYCPNLEYFLEQFNRWFVHHFQLDSKHVVGRPLFSAGGLGNSFLDVNTALTIEKPGAVSDGCVVHNAIIPIFGGFIKSLMTDKISLWLNPPYGRSVVKWMQKAYEESLQGCMVVCLVPSRTDTKWWHEYASNGYRIYIKGRLKFGGMSNSAPFPSVLVVFGGSRFLVSGMRRALAAAGYQSVT